MDYLPSQDDPAGQEKNKSKSLYEIICITKITMIAKYLEDTTINSTNLHFLATHYHASVLNNSSSYIL